MDRQGQGPQLDSEGMVDIKAGSQVNSARIGSSYAEKQCKLSLETGNSWQEKEADPWEGGRYLIPAPGFPGVGSVYNFLFSHKRLLYYEATKPMNTGIIICRKKVYKLKNDFHNSRVLPEVKKSQFFPLLFLVLY